jgi:hypothetical protein
LQDRTLPWERDLIYFKENIMKKSEVISMSGVKSEVISNCHEYYPCGCSTSDDGHCTNCCHLPSDYHCESAQTAWVIEQEARACQKQLNTCRKQLNICRKQLKKNNIKTAHDSIKSKTLTKVYIRKGGSNPVVSQVQTRPDAPAPMKSVKKNKKRRKYYV